MMQNMLCDSAKAGDEVELEPSRPSQQQMTAMMARLAETEAQLEALTAKVNASEGGAATDRPAPGTCGEPFNYWNETVGKEVGQGGIELPAGIWSAALIASGSLPD